MANNYCESSSMIEIPPEKMEAANEIMLRIISEIEQDPEGEGCVGFDATIEDKGVWIRSEESIDVEQAETLVCALVDELDLPGIHIVSWNYTCSKLRVDEFGGGAFAVQKGHDTVWVDAAQEAERQAIKKAVDKMREGEQ